MKIKFHNSTIDLTGCPRELNSRGTLFKSGIVWFSCMWHENEISSVSIQFNEIDPKVAFLIVPRHYLVGDEKVLSEWLHYSINRLS